MRGAKFLTMFGGSGQWRLGFAKLQAAAAAQKGTNTPHQNSAMASPPTITTGTSQPSGLTVANKWSDASPPFRYYGGTPVTVSSVYKFITPVSIAATGGNLGLNNGQNANTWRIDCGAINSAKFAFLVRGSSGQAYRFIIDGQYVDTTGTVAGTTGGQFYVALDFTSVGGKTARHVVLEGQANDGFIGVYIASGDTITQTVGGYLAPSNIIRGIFVGDSFVAGTGATAVGDALGIICGELLGINDIWLDGVGGSGYVATNGGAVYNLQQHPNDYIANSPDIGIMPMGLNDIGQSAAAIQSAAAAVIANYRQACPAAPLFVVGPWDKNAPSAPAAGFTATRDAIKTACMSRTGVFFIDPIGVEFTKFTDSTHPDTPGHSTLGTWLAGQIQTILGV